MMFIHKKMDGCEYKIPIHHGDECSCMILGEILNESDPLPNHLCSLGANESVRRWIADRNVNCDEIDDRPFYRSHPEKIYVGCGDSMYFDDLTHHPIYELNVRSSRVFNKTLVACIRQWVEEPAPGLITALHSSSEWKSLCGTLKDCYTGVKHEDLILSFEDGSYKNIYAETIEKVKLELDLKKNYINLLEEEENPFAHVEDAERRKELLSGLEIVKAIHSIYDYWGLESYVKNYLLDFFCGTAKVDAYLSKSIFLNTPGLLKYLLYSIGVCRTSFEPTRGLLVTSFVYKSQFEGELQLSAEGEEFICTTEILGKIPRATDSLWRRANKTAEIHQKWCESIFRCKPEINDLRRAHVTQKNDLNDDIDLVLRGEMLYHYARERNKERYLLEEAVPGRDYSKVEREAIEKRACKNFDMQYKRRKAKLSEAKAA